MRWYLHVRFRKTLDELNICKLQFFIDTGRIDPSKTITMKHLFDTRIVGNIQHGVKLLSKVRHISWNISGICLALFHATNWLLYARRERSGSSNLSPLRSPVHLSRQLMLWRTQADVWPPSTTTGLAQGHVTSALALKFVRVEIRNLFDVIASLHCYHNKYRTHDASLLCRLGLRALLKPHTFEGPLPRRARPKPKDMPYYTSFSNRFGFETTKWFYHLYLYWVDFHYIYLLLHLWRFPIDRARGYLSPEMQLSASPFVDQGFPSDPKEVNKLLHPQIVEVEEQTDEAHS